MTILNEAESKVLKGLRDAVENVTGEWGTVYLDNVVASVSEKQFAGYLSALKEKGLYKGDSEDECFGYVKVSDDVEEVKTTKIAAGHYRIERKGYAIEVRKESKRKWVNIATNEVKKTLAEFEAAVAAYVAPAPAKKSEKPKAEKKAKSQNYKGHRNERTARLHKAFDEMERAEAMKFAIEELGYTEGGASSWFADWTKQDADNRVTAA